MAVVLAANQEAQEAWNGVLFDRFVAFRELLLEGLAPHGDAALAICPPQPGERVLDIGCGFGDASRQIAALVGAQGSVHGVDIAPRFVETAAAEAQEAGAANVTFAVHDVQAHGFEARFDYAFSRFGTMFFDNPVPALRHVREALEPGGRLCMVVWRQKVDNPWLHAAELVVKPLIEEPEETDEPRCGPGPFSMAGADTTSGVLKAAGFTEIALHRCDLPSCIGRDLDEAIALTTALGPAAEVIRLAGAAAADLIPEVEAKLRDAFAPFVQDDGRVMGDSSTWTVTARAPR